MDFRAQKYTEGAELSFKMGDKDVRTLEFFEYDNGVINIPMNEIERMGQWLIDNPETEVSQEFYGTDIKIIKYQMQHIKEKCKTSKLPLNMIQNAYQSIKKVILNVKENIKFQEEMGR